MHIRLVGEVPDHRHRPGSRAVVERDLRNDHAVWHYGDVRGTYAAASRSYELDKYGPAGQPGNIGLLAACRLHLRTANCP